MHGEKINLVIGTFERLLKFLDEDDRLSIIIFGDTAKRLTPLLRMTDLNKKRTIKIVSGIQVDGGTNIGAGMDQALSVLKYRKCINDVTGIFLLTDGLEKGAK